jgi:hypothetical protein
MISQAAYHSLASHQMLVVFAGTVSLFVRDDGPPIAKSVRAVAVV